ncbi:hypothetical protein PPYR_14740 [Photinus pyralis]|uniref:Uncharacterized protein n=2 Tax=Photinus pyralis TaxID=7054 RepID=A0A5N4A644_PHOPY|nr:hypothetical protein PPYR_14740 [Photinus pyralis]
MPICTLSCSSYGTGFGDLISDSKTLLRLIASKMLPQSWYPSGNYKCYPPVCGVCNRCLVVPKPVEIPEHCVKDIISTLYHRNKKCCHSVCPNRIVRRPSNITMRCYVGSRPDHNCCRVKRCRQTCCSRRVQTPSVESCTVKILCNTRNIDSKSTCAKPSCRSIKALKPVDSTCYFSDDCCPTPAPTVKFNPKCLPECAKPCDPCPKPCVSKPKSRRSVCEVVECKDDCPAVCADGVILRTVMYYCDLLSKPIVALPILSSIFCYVFKTVSDCIAGFKCYK